jgi:hypothetical protein
LEVPASFFVVDREADFGADFAGVFRPLLGWVPPFFFAAIVIPSSTGAESRPY